MFVLIPFLLAIFLIPINRVSHDLDNYNNQYKQLLKENCPSEKYYNPNKIVIEFEKMNRKDAVVGICYRNYPVSFTIKIDSFYWSFCNDFQKRQLFFHEAAHCYLGIDHDDSKVHYMNSDINPNLTEEELKQQVVEDIKRICK